MPCDHKQPEDIIEMAVAWLRERGIEARDGMRVRHAENTPGGMWASVVIEMERRDGAWVVTRLDRNSAPLADDDCGLEVVV